MKPYIVNYMKAHGIDHGDWMACAHCGKTAVDLNHIRPKRMGGQKFYEEDGETIPIDDPRNLIPLCRKCHNLAHDGTLTISMLRILKKASRPMQ